MRRICSELVRDLHLPVPAEPKHLVEALCKRMGEHLGAPVVHQLYPFEPETVTGLWVNIAGTNYVICELRASPWHRIGILAHEFWHMLAGHDGLPLERETSAHQLMDLDEATVARIVAARTHCHGKEEIEAELFSTIFHTTVTRWAERQVWSVPSHAAEVVGRLEASFGHQHE